MYKPNEIGILGVTVHPITKDDLHAYMDATIARHDRALVLNVNVHAMNLAHTDRDLKNFFNRAEIVFCDGIGVMLAARLLGEKVPERITYADWMWELAAYAEPRQLSFFFLGAKPGVAEQAAQRLQTRFPRLKIVGVQHGYFDRARDSAENKAVIQRINELRPNILVVGFGMPIQEQWLAENWDALDANIALTGGAVFDYLSGSLRRGPKWMTDNGLEWAARLLIEPQRLWKRYVVGNPLFLWRVFWSRLGFYR
ncbi:MAG: WecB/TagA/CpsF family glycosyltransferase [Litorilinea sp.]